MCSRETTRAPAFQQHWQESQYLWQSVGLPTFPLSPFLSLSLWSPLRSEKRKTNSFPYKWSESLQPRDPVELQIFHLCLGASHYYSLAIISSLSFFLIFCFYFSALIPTHLHYPPMLMLTQCTSIYHLVFQITHLTEKKHPPTTYYYITTPSVQSKITLLQSKAQFKLPIQWLSWTLIVSEQLFGRNPVMTFKCSSSARKHRLPFSFYFFVLLSFPATSLHPPAS